MSKGKNNQVLNIAFFARPAKWIYDILRELNPEQKKDYNNCPLYDLGVSISKKISLLRTLVSDVNLEMIEINRILRREKKEVEWCINNNKAFLFQDIHHIYRIYAYTEAVLTNTYSVVEFIFKYIKFIYKYIFGERLSNVKQELINNEIDIGWREDLKKIRNDLLHNYAAWVYFKKQNNHFKLVISLPNSIKKRGGYKQFPNDVLDTDEINRILEEFSRFFDKVNEFLIEKIRDKS